MNSMRTIHDDVDDDDDVKDDVKRRREKTTSDVPRGTGFTVGF